MPLILLDKGASCGQKQAMKTIPQSCVAGPRNVAYHKLPILAFFSKGLKPPTRWDLFFRGGAVWSCTRESWVSSGSAALRGMEGFSCHLKGGYLMLVIGCRCHRAFIDGGIAMALPGNLRLRSDKCYVCVVHAFTKIVYFRACTNLIIFYCSTLSRALPWVLPASLGTIRFHECSSTGWFNHHLA